VCYIPASSDRIAATFQRKEAFMKTSLLCPASFVAALLTLAGCDQGTISPLPTTPALSAAPAPPAPPASPAPPLSGPSTTYRFSGPLDYPVHHFTETSSYVLYDNGAFGLRYESPSGFTYTGSYRREDARIIFSFVSDGRQDAVGTLRGDLLELRYGELMQHSDFDNAVYRRTS
jgi:hypothetical protein